MHTGGRLRVFKFVIYMLLTENIALSRTHEVVNCSNGMSDCSSMIRIEEKLNLMRSDMKDTNRQIQFLEIRSSQTQTAVDSLKADVNLLTHIIKNWGDGIQFLVSSQGDSNKCPAANSTVNTNISNEMLKEIKVISTTQSSLTSNIANSIKSEIGLLKSELSALKEGCTRNMSLYENSKPRLPRSCSELKDRGETKTGVYKIQPNKNSYFVYCDMEYMGGGWTVFQRRFSGGIDFFKGWQDYKLGFGNIAGEHWLGLEKVHEITDLEVNELAVVLENFEGVKKYALYSAFSIGSEIKGYDLEVLGGYSGDAGDSLIGQAGMRFTTKDKDQDTHAPDNCANLYSGAWWYTACHGSNLNGQYLKGKTTIYAKGMVWNTFEGLYYSLKTAMMMIRPKK